MIGVFSNGGVIGRSLVYNDTSNTYTRFIPSDLPSLIINANGLEGANNNIFQDSSNNNFTITRNGNVTQGSFTPHMDPDGYWSNFFDGNGDSLTFAANSAFSITTSTTPFTIEAWVYPTAVGGCVFSEAFTGSGAVNIAVSMSSTTGADSTAGRRICFGYYTGSVWVTAAAATTELTLHRWTHVACVFTGSTTRIYLDGIDSTAASPTPATTWGVTVSNGDSWYVGRRWDTSTSPWFSGYISNLRFVRGTAVYTTNFTPSTTPLTAIANTSLLTCQSNRFRDNSTNLFLPTSQGDVRTTTFGPFQPTAEYNAAVNGGAGFFDGNGDWLEIPTGTSGTNFGTGNWTIEFWVYNITATSTSWKPFVAIGNSGGGQEIRIGQNINAGGYGFVIPNNTNNSDRTVAIGTLPLNQWHHIALVRNGSNVRLYRNGIDVGGFTDASFNFTNAGATRLGYGYYVSDGVFTGGYIADFRIVKGTAVYTTNFTPPTEPLTSVANTSLLISSSNAGIFDLTGKTVIETVGNPQVNTAITRFGSGSIRFDGVDDYLVINTHNSNLFAFGTGDFTVEMWIYPITFPAAGSYIIFYDHRPTSTNGAYPTIGLKGNTVVYYTSTADRITSSAISSNTWTHLALTRSGTSTRLFINGTQAGSTYTDSATYLNTSQRPVIGDGNNLTASDFNGYIDDIQVIKGFAKYTSNFSPPDSEQKFVYEPFGSNNLGGSGVWSVLNGNVIGQRLNYKDTNRYTFFPESERGTTILLNTNSVSGSNNKVFLDSSPNNFTITPSGNTTQGTFSPFSVAEGRWSNYFDGSDWLGLPISTNLEFGTGDFTAECWACPTNGGYILAGPTGTFVFTLGSDGIRIGREFIAFDLHAQTTVPLGVWHHVAVCRSSSGFNFFLNGTSIGTFAQNAFSYSSSGGYIARGGTYFTGHISNLRLIKGTALYSSNFTPPTSPLTAISNTSLLTCQSNRFVDNSTNNFTLTRNGDSRVTAFSPFVPTAEYNAAVNGGAGFFDGNGDNLTVASNTSFNLNNSEFTIECWLYKLSDKLSTIISQSEFFWRLQTVATGAFAFYTDAGGFDTEIISSSTFPINSWHHIAVVRSGTTITLYVNGVNQGSKVDNPPNDNSGLNIGRNPSTTAWDFNGYLSNIRIVKGTALYTSNFTPPTAPLTAITNTSLLLNFTNAGIFDGTGRNILETVGQTQVNTAIQKYGTSSFRVNATGGLSAFNSDAAIFGTGDFTIEGWIYPTTWINLGFFTSQFADTSPSSSGLSITSDDLRGIFVYSGTSYITQGFGTQFRPVENQWTHLAVVRNNGVIGVWFNGVLLESANFTNNITSNKFTIGYGSCQSNIDDFRITKGIALYTSTFTPPNELKYKSISSGSNNLKNSGIWNMKILAKELLDPLAALDSSGLAGLAGKFFNGSWRSTLATGNIGTLPLTTTNDSSNVTGTGGLPSANHRYGVNLWTSINYTTLGDNYGFIAIGYFKPPTTGTYTFYTSSDDYSGVWVGDIAAAASGRTSSNAVVNNGLGLTAGQGNTKRSGTISLVGGTWYPIRIVHEEGAGGDNLTFSWAGPGIPETTDLSVYFKTPAVGGVLTGNYITV